MERVRDSWIKSAGKPAVGHQDQKQEREIKNRDEEESASRFIAIRRAEKEPGFPEKMNSEAEGDCKVKETRIAEEKRQKGDQQQDRAENKSVPSGAVSRFIDHCQHRKFGGGIIFSIDP